MRKARRWNSLISSESSFPALSTFPCSHQRNLSVCERRQKPERRFHVVCTPFDLCSRPFLRRLTTGNGVERTVPCLWISIYYGNWCFITSDAELIAVVLYCSSKCGFPCFPKAPVLPIAGPILQKSDIHDLDSTYPLCEMPTVSSKYLWYTMCWKVILVTGSYHRFSSVANHSLRHFSRASSFSRGVRQATCMGKVSNVFYE